MDFIEQLPRSQGHSAILVIVDQLTKQAIFTPTHDTIDAPKLASLFLTNIFLKHGAPSHITSDQGLEFVSHFFSVRECPSSTSIPTNPNHARHTLPRSQHEMSDGTPKTVRTAIPKHRGKLYQLWETVTVLTFLFRLCHLYFTI